MKLTKRKCSSRWRCWCKNFGTHAAHGRRNSSSERRRVLLMEGRLFIFESAVLGRRYDKDLRHSSVVEALLPALPAQLPLAAANSALPISHCPHVGLHRNRNTRGLAGGNAHCGRNILMKKAAKDAGQGLLEQCKESRRMFVSYSKQQTEKTFLKIRKRVLQTYLGHTSTVCTLYFHLHLSAVPMWLFDSHSS